MNPALQQAKLALTRDERRQVSVAVFDRLERYLTEAAALPVAPPRDPEAIRRFLAPFDFSTPMSPTDAVAVAADGLTKWQVHTTNPRYFGLFVPAPTGMGVAADALVSGFNPQPIGLLSPTMLPRTDWRSPIPLTSPTPRCSQ